MRTVGRAWLADAVGAGNQCMRIFVPSNDVRSQSLAIPATFVATGFGPVGGVHFSAAAVPAGLVVDDEAAGAPEFDPDEEQAASTPTNSAVPIARTRPDIRTSIRVPRHEALRETKYCGRWNIPATQPFPAPGA